MKSAYCINTDIVWRFFGIIPVSYVRYAKLNLGLLQIGRIHGGSLFSYGKEQAKWSVTPLEGCKRSGLLFDPPGG